MDLSMSVISSGGVERRSSEGRAEPSVCVCALALRWLGVMLQNINQVLQRAAAQVLLPGSSSGGEGDVNEDN